MPLLQHSQRGHATRTRLPQRRRAGEPAPVVSPRDLPHPQPGWDPSQIERGKPCTADWNRVRMEIVVIRRGLRDAPYPKDRDKAIALYLTHADQQAQRHLRSGSANHDGSAASTSEARNRQHYARLGQHQACFDEPGDKLAHFGGGAKLWVSRGRR